MLEELAAEFAGRLKVLKLDAEEAPQAAERYGITHVPTLILFKDGKEAWRRRGAAPRAALAAELQGAL